MPSISLPLEIAPMLLLLINTRRELFYVEKACMTHLKVETQCTNWPITMFSDYDISNIFTVRLRVIDVITIYKHDEITILLNAIVNPNIASDKVVQLFYRQIIHFC